MLAEEEEQPRRGRRGMMIAAALVGAIGLGGALAYTYKTFVASSGGRAPVIKAADFGPNKVKPVVQDGKSFPNTDKKLLNRLGEDGSARPGRVVGRRQRAGRRGRQRRSQRAAQGQDHPHHAAAARRRRRRARRRGPPGRRWSPFPA